jgi:hypothetical protein
MKGRGEAISGGTGLFDGCFDALLELMEKMMLG